MINLINFGKLILAFFSGMVIGIYFVGKIDEPLSHVYNCSMLVSKVINSVDCFDEEGLPHGISADYDERGRPSGMRMYKKGKLDGWAVYLDTIPFSNLNNEGWVNPPRINLIKWENNKQLTTISFIPEIDLGNKTDEKASESIQALQLMELILGK